VHDKKRLQTHDPLAVVDTMDELKLLLG